MRVTLLLGMYALLGVRPVGANVLEHVAPYVDTDRFPAMELMLEDSSGQGTMVTIEPLRRDGSALRSGGKVVAVRRAIPPRDRIVVPLLGIVGKGFRGACRVTTSRRVTGQIRARSLHYDLAPVTELHAHEAPLPSGAHTLVIHNPESSDGNVRVRALSGGAERTIRDGRLAAFASWWLDVSPDESVRVRIDSETGSIVLLLTGPESAVTGAIGYVAR